MPHTPGPEAPAHARARSPDTLAAIATAAALVVLSACSAAPSDATDPKPAASLQEPGTRRSEGYVVELPFEAAMRRLDDACSAADADYLRDQWQRVRPGANMGTGVREGNRLAITTRLAECVQPWVPDQEADASGWLLDLSRSDFPSHRANAALAMRESQGKPAVSALFNAAIDADPRVSRAALQSLRWKLESAGMSDAREGEAADAALIARNIVKLCADARLPPQNADACAAVTLPRP